MRHKITITLSIPDGSREKLEKLASKFDCYWGNKPSISGLIEAIAEEKITIIKPSTLSKELSDLNNNFDNLINQREEKQKIILEIQKLLIKLQES